MELSKRRAILSMLAQPVYLWAKAFCATRFHYYFIPESDTLFPIVCSVFGLIPKQTKETP